MRNLETLTSDIRKPSTKAFVNISGLESDLRAGIRGEVRFSNGDRAMYASDAGNYRMVPIGVIMPRNAEDVVYGLQACRHYGAPVVGRGGGTGIPGQTVNAAVVFDFSKYMNHILEIHPGQRWAWVEPGIIPDQVKHAASPFGLTFGPDPATHNRNTIGGMVSNNSCGIHSVMAGETVDNVHELDVITYDGLRLRVGPTSDLMFQQILNEGGRKADIYRGLRDLRDRYGERIRREFPMIPRRVSGFNLPALLPDQGFDIARALVGTEGTCVLVLAAKLKLVDNPPVRSLLVLGYENIFEAGEGVVEPMKFKPVGLEALDDVFFDYMKRKGMHPPHVPLPDGKAWLLVEFGGKTKEDADSEAKKCMEDLKKLPNPPSMKLFDDPEYEQLVWKLREEGLGATAKVPGLPDNHEGWEDASVPPTQLGHYLRNFKKLLDKFEYEGPLYGHFGQGCVHTRITFDLETAPGIEKFRHFVAEASDLVVKYGGSLSGEHGDGQARGEMLGHMYSPEIIEAFREFKAIWDPQWKMNPGKVVEPYRIDENLRQGKGYHLPQLETHFHFPEDHYSFSLATDRCVGAGVCRRHESGTMCPSYMVTHEEKHSTRGRARLLNEMVRGEVLHEGWKSEAVKEALDLCLSCKGCKHDCPVQVDMAAYKAEFLSHYYQGRLRPRYAYASGLIYWWSRLASHMPATANFFTQTPGLSALAKATAGYSQHRHIPPFAPQTFKEWFQQRPAIDRAGKGEVILWADTFNNHFTPKVAKAAVEVLEHAGYHVRVPQASLCCGRPLYDYGMIDTAKSLLTDTLSVLREPIRNGTPIVGLEPSCMSVFREEMVNLFPNDEDAKRLHQQSFTLSEFLHDHADGYVPPRLQRKAVVHGHCHDKSVLDFKKQTDLLKKAGVEVNELDSGCCGMAGSFGYEADHYDVGLACGERVLLPAVRQATENELIVSDGFSCREMIRQETERNAMHFAQVLQMALHEGPSGSSGRLPERRYTAIDRTPAVPLTVIATGAAFAAGVWWLLKKRTPAA